MKKLLHSGQNSEFDLTGALHASQKYSIFIIILSAIQRCLKNKDLEFMEKTEIRDQDSFLRRYIERLKLWSEANPPSSEELEALNKEFRLTRKEQETLAKLARNHIQRGRTSLERGQLEQAAAELSRASQLRPRDPAPRIELAEVWLDSRQKPSTVRNNRKKALKLARAAYSLEPHNPQVLRFIKAHKWMSIVLKPRRPWQYMAYPLALILLFFLLLIWRWDWISSFFQPPSPVIPANRQAEITVIPDSRDIQVNTQALNGGPLTPQIVFAEVGRKNNASYLHLIGRLKSQHQNIQSAALEIWGRDSSGELLFTMPWNALDENSPPLLAGDTLPFTAFRWLETSEAPLQNLEIHPGEIEFIPANTDIPIMEPEVVWNTLRPEGTALAAEIRDQQIYEAYDRQVISLDIALENTGVTELSELAFSLSMNQTIHSIEYNFLDSPLLPLQKGERRVVPAIFSMPLDKRITDSRVAIHIIRADR
ncbi:MAG: hypothetical protein B0D92_05105 [Spirochaeta sp. LUC14_002_19_P3]|nr:MAG: hypothetical protein B0D92_05105 [Spirochaeta sp. LUC14_002_19_P3]